MSGTRFPRRSSRDPDVGAAPRRASSPGRRLGAFLWVSRFIPPGLKGALRRLPGVAALADRVYAHRGFVTAPIPGLGVLLEIDARNPRERALIMGHHEPYVVRWLRETVKPGWRCVDVGGHIGFYAVQLGHLVGEMGQVVAFEPEPVLASRLERNAALNGLRWVAVERLALGDSPGRATLWVERTPSGPGGTNSLVRRNFPGSAIEVETMRLDDWIAERGWERLDLVKIDVEGLEPQVLQGAGRTLKRFRPLVIAEFNDEPARRAAETILREHRYRIRELGRMPSCIHVVAEPRG